MKKLLLLLLLIFLIPNSSFASDFIIPSSGNEPVLIDISNLNLGSDISVSIGNQDNQTRSYIGSGIKSLTVFPTALSPSEKTIEIRSGSSSILKSISFRSSPQGTLKSGLLPSLKSPKGGNTTTKISDGRVIISGGSKELVNLPLSTVEIFNPDSGKIESLKNITGLQDFMLATPRSLHTATYLGISNLPVGKISGPVEQILLAGGFSTDGKILDSLEILEIQTGTNQATSTILTSKKSKLKKSRLFHTANTLPDGKIIFIGGQGNINKTMIGALSSIEIFDPATKTFSTSGISLNVPRLLHTATTLQNGNILISGGFKNDTTDSFGIGNATESAELIDTKKLSIKLVGSLVNNEGLGGHSATLIGNGAVVLAGGCTSFFNQVQSNTAKGTTKSTLQFFNPSSETFNNISSIAGSPLTLQTSRFLHSAVLLPNNNLVFIGGSNIKQINSSALANTPVSLIEPISIDLNSLNGAILRAEPKTTLDTYNGRILPSAILVSPKNKTQGFFLSSDINSFINNGIFLTGGFINGLGKLPTGQSEFLHTIADSTVEGRKIKLNPDGVLLGSSLNTLNIGLDTFNTIPSLKLIPQTINLSPSNSFIATAKISSSNNSTTLLKATFPSDSITVSPSLFQVGETLTITRKTSSINGEFEITIEPAQGTSSFIPVKAKINISDSAKPFLASSKGGGISIATSNNAETITLKVLSADGNSEVSSVPLSTEITATISDPSIANLGGTGITSVKGNLSTPFIINGIKAGKTEINFSINFPNILNLKIPIEVSGTPVFSNPPIDSSILSSLTDLGLNISKASIVNATNITLDDLRLSPGSSIFPSYIPANFLSSINGSSIKNTFTFRPLFGVDSFTGAPRTLVNPIESMFKNISESPTAIAGIAGTSDSDSFLFLGFSDGVKFTDFSKDTNKNISGILNRLSNISNPKDLKAFSFNTAENVKVLALKDNKVSIIDTDTSIAEKVATLSGTGLELETFKIGTQDAALISVGKNGLDLIFPVTDENPRVVNIKLPGHTEHISIADKLINSTNKENPFAIAYNSSSQISVINLVDLQDDIRTIDTGNEKIRKISYAGKFIVNGKLVDLVCAVTERKILFFDITNRTSVTIPNPLKIKNVIKDMVVVDGIIYLALGNGGLSIINTGALLNSNNFSPEITNIKQNRLIINNSNGSQTILTKPMNAEKLSVSKPFLFVSGLDNPISIIKISP